MAAIYEVADGDKGEHVYMTVEPATISVSADDKGGNSTGTKKSIKHVIVGLLIFIALLILAGLGVLIYTQNTDVECKTPSVTALIPGQMVKPSYKLAEEITGLACVGGEELVGDSSLVCQEDGTWSGTATCVEKQEYQRVCYYSNLSQYRKDVGKFFPTDIDPYLCTHLVYSFAKLSNYELAMYEWNDDKHYREFNELKLVNPELKTLIAVGGWNEGSVRFSPLVADPALRANFVTTSVAYVKQYGFDGLDLNWEYPGSRPGSDPADKENFVLLLKELRAAFDSQSPPLLLTAAVPAGKANIDAGYNVPELDSNLDFIFLMSYDLSGAWNPYTGFNSPLYPRSDEPADQRILNMEWAANYWVAKGASPKKLIIGMATYGRAFTLTDASKFQPGDAARGAGTTGPYTGEAGFLAYYEICLQEERGTGTRYWEDEQRVPYYVDGNQWIGYDDIYSLSEKVEWMMESGFGGWMVWNIDLDDFNMECKSSATPYPLITLLKDLVEGDTTPATNPPATTAETTTQGQTTSGSTRSTAGTTVEATTESPVTDKPNDDFCVGKDDGFYAHPSDCSMYYQCVDEYAYSNSCPGNLVWSQSGKVCDYSYNVDCGGATTTVEPATTTETVEYDDFCVGKLDGMYADPDDCQMYYKCWTECAYSWCCPGDLHWSQKDQTCVHPEDSTCGSTTTDAPTTTTQPIVSSTNLPATTTTDLPPSTTDTPASTTTSTTNLEDFCVGKRNGLHKNPNDCSGYIQCHDDRMWIMPCTAGLLFDALALNCDWSYQVDCSDVTDESGFCDGKSGPYPYPDDCSRYYNCGSGESVSIVLKCLDSLFDAQNGYCGHSESVDCGTRPLPDK